MESALSVNVTPFQLLIAMAFQLWLLIFPIMILRKIDRLERTLNDLIVEDAPEAAS